MGSLFRSSYGSLKTMSTSPALCTCVGSRLSPLGVVRSISEYTMDPTSPYSIFKGHFVVFAQLFNHVFSGHYQIANQIIIFPNTNLAQNSNNNINFHSTSWSQSESYQFNSFHMQQWKINK